LVIALDATTEAERTSRSPIGVFKVALKAAGDIDRNSFLIAVLKVDERDSFLGEVGECDASIGDGVLA
jgi:hypothetical protein